MFNFKLVLPIRAERGNQLMFAHNKAFRPKEVEIYKNQIKVLARKLLAKEKLELDLSPNNRYDVIIKFIFLEPKTSVYSFPVLNDLDNLTKPLLDALNGIFWNDDKYLHSLYLQKDWGEENKIEIEVNISEDLRRSGKIH